MTEANEVKTAHQLLSRIEENKQRFQMKQKLNDEQTLQEKIFAFINEENEQEMKVKQKSEIIKKKAIEKREKVSQKMKSFNNDHSA